MPIPSRIASDPQFSNIYANRAGTRDGISDAIPDATDAELDAALTTIDQDALWDAEYPKWTNEIWDRTSPINGVPAADVLAARDDVPVSGDVVLVRGQSGAVVIFQPCEPGIAGVVAIPDGAASGLVMTEELVAARVSGETARLAVESINTSRGA